MKRALVVLGATLGALVLLELGFRLLEGPLGLRRRIVNGRAFLLDGTMVDYEPNAHTVFRRPRKSDRTNSLGFWGPEWETEKTPGVPRILCLGSSTSEVFTADSYPLQLERLLENATGHDFEVLVAAVSGWSSAEELVSWFLRLQDYHPDLLLYHCAINDVVPRLHADFETDYSHWRRPLRGSTKNPIEALAARFSDLYVYSSGLGWPDVTTLSSYRLTRSDPLTHEGKLRRESSLPYRRNVRSIAASARAQGASVALMTMPVRQEAETPTLQAWLYGVAEHNQHLRELCEEDGYLLIDCERAFADRPELQGEFQDMCHLKIGGDRVKAESAAKVLLEGWVAKLPAGALAR